MIVHTPATLRRVHRALDRRRAAAAAVVAAMANGASLNLSFSKHGSAWMLSTGASVTAEVALMVLNHTHVVGCGDGLFGGGPCQTWRYVEP
jgi:hypothetical protein